MQDGTCNHDHNHDHDQRILDFNSIQIESDNFVW